MARSKLMDLQLRKTRYSEVGPHGTLKLVNIFNYLQDAADEHAIKLGLSAIQLRNMGYAWILHKVRVKVAQYPIWDKTLTIRTWPFMFNRLYEMRNFEVTDQDNETVLSAATCWIMLDLKKGRPARIDRTPFAEIMKGCNPVENNFSEIEELDQVHSELAFRVRAHDLDSNRHVNNSIYPAWAVETVPPWFIQKGMTGELDTLRPLEMEVNFLSAAVYGDEVVCQTQHLGSQERYYFIHQILRVGDGKVLSRLKSSWGKVSNEV